MLIVPVKLLANPSVEYDINQDFSVKRFDNDLFRGEIWK